MTSDSAFSSSIFDSFKSNFALDEVMGWVSVEINATGTTYYKAENSSVICTTSSVIASTMYHK